MTQQIVVMKSCAGFVDRLQCLSHLIQYCITNQAILCVDWRDEHWGQGKLDFHDFFEILGVYTIPISVVARIVGAKVVPSCWTPELIRNPLATEYYTPEYSCPIMKDDFARVHGDILVTNGKGRRFYQTSVMLTNLRFKKSVSDLIKQRLLNFRLPATVVHLRGTDRYIPEIIDRLFKEYDALHEIHKKRVYHISDSVELMDEWTKKVPNSQICNPNCSVLKITDTTKKATHMMDAHELKAYGISKYDLIIDSLADFVALSFASVAIGQEQSVYFEIARKLATYAGPGALAAWLNGYKPQVI
jgi:hypothetical protein